MREKSQSRKKKKKKKKKVWEREDGSVWEQQILRGNIWGSLKNFSKLQLLVYIID
jgi:hypothetical protein